MLELIAMVGGVLLMIGHHSRSEALFYYFRLEDQVPSKEAEGRTRAVLAGRGGAEPQATGALPPSIAHSAPDRECLAEGKSTRAANIHGKNNVSLTEFFNGHRRSF